MIQIGVLSDTHGFFRETMLAIHKFHECGVHTIVHCGDIGGPDIVKAFQGFDTHFVFGNVDGENDSLRRAAEETGNTIHGWFGAIERAEKRIAFLHGHQTEKFEQELNSGRWDLICFGHTHVASLQTHRNTVLLNPGAFKRVFRPTIAVVALPEINVQRFDLPAIDSQSNLS